MSNKILYDFDGFRVDTEQKCLWRGEKLVSITPKAFETLLVLIKNQGRVMSKNALLDEVWKDTFVEESTLAQNISTLRKTLAKYEKEKKFIVTIPRRGYRFIADVTEILADEEVLFVEKHSVTHIVAEQEIVESSTETAIEPQTKPSPALQTRSFFSKRLLIFASLIFVPLLLLGFFAISYLYQPNTFYGSKFQKFQMNALFSEANIKGALGSPDGKYLIVIKKKADGDTISLKQIKDGNTIETLPNSDLNMIGATFSPNSDYVYYSAYKKDNAKSTVIGKLYKIPILGGAPQEVLGDIDSPVGISVDGKSLAFVRNKLKQKKSVLIVSDIDGANEKELATRDSQNGFSTTGLSWSPDGKLISTVVIDREDETTPTKIVVIDTESGEQKTLTTQNWLWIGQTNWLNDGSGIAFVAYGSKSPNLTDEIWFVSYPEGEAKVITKGINGINGISVASDANSIIATKSNRITNVYVSPLDDLENAVEIAKNANEESLLSLSMDWTPDEKIVYGKTNNGNTDIWIMNADGSNSKQLTSDESADFAPVVTTDGRYIYFFSNRSGAMNIWRMGANGENATEIIKAKNLFPPTVSEKNDYIYYSAKATDKTYSVLWRADLDGKNIRQITTNRTYFPKVSPDGKYIFCFSSDAEKDSEDLSQPLRFTLLSAEDGKVIKQYGSLKSRNFPIVKWKKTHTGFLIVENDDTPKLLFQPIDADEPIKLKEWQSGEIYQIAISKDGKRLIYKKGEEVNSIIQIKNIS